MAAHRIWNIEPVVLADAPALASNNISAYWEDDTFRRRWDSTITPEYLIEQETARIPDALLYRRDILRHLKATDPCTGELIGYLRAALPLEHATMSDGSPVWPETQIADVNAEERKGIREVAENAWYNPKDDGSEDRAFETQKEILSKGVYIKLRYLAVHPKYQRKGVGAALVTALKKVAEELGVDIYLMGYEAGRSLYEKLGFREIDRCVEDGINNGIRVRHVAYFMVYSVSIRDISSAGAEH